MSIKTLVVLIIFSLVGAVIYFDIPVKSFLPMGSENVHKVKKNILKDASLPVSVRADKYLKEIKKKFRNKKYKEAVVYFEALERLNVELEPSFIFFYAKALLNADNIDRAIDKFYEYLGITGSNGEYYNNALDLIAEAEERAEDNKENDKLLAIGSVLGDDDAPITITEYTNYQCPYCKLFSEKTFPKIKKKFINKGKVRFISRNFPSDFHPYARKAAQAVSCAGDQGKYWEMREEVFNNNQNLQVEALIDYAANIGLDDGDFQRCIYSMTHLYSIEEDIERANAAGIQGTPSFVMSATFAPDVEDVIIVGAIPYSDFAADIKEFLKETRR